MKITIRKITEVELEVNQVIELRHGDKDVWGHGFIVSIFDFFDLSYALVRVVGYADHPYLVEKVKEDNGTLYFYEGET
jgi:hypothetical protein